MFVKLKRVFSKPDSFFSRISQLFSTNKLDQAFLDQLYEHLISADFGYELSSLLLQKFKTLNYASSSDLNSAFLLARLKEIIALELKDICTIQESDSSQEQGMTIIMLCGVNGNGKTTTVGKLSHILRSKHKVVVGACDTFRAAAKEQLKLWVVKTGVHLVEGKEGCDPSSVAYTSVEYGLQHNADVVMLDTAGRLHNKKNLMDELVKINKVIQKLAPNAKHERWLVLDASTGQNAIDQVSFFKEAIDINGIVITKLDGTGRAGFAVHLMKKFGIPIKYLCTGEQIDDISQFSLDAFLDAMFS